MLRHVSIVTSSGGQAEVHPDQECCHPWLNSCLLHLHTLHSTFAGRNAVRSKQAHMQQLFESRSSRGRTSFRCKGGWCLPCKMTSPVGLMYSPADLALMCRCSLRASVNIQGPVLATTSCSKKSCSQALRSCSAPSQLSPGAVMQETTHCRDAGSRSLCLVRKLLHKQACGTQRIARACQGLLVPY